MPDEKTPDPRQANKGWREIGGKRHYFKSRWEANFAYYLQWMKDQGHISDWEYEPHKFWFKGIKSGVTNYTPDFKIFHKKTIKYPDGRAGEVEYAEVKGYMDARSLTKIKRMRIYHKDVLIRIIDHTWFKSNRELCNIVPGWETEPK